MSERKGEKKLRISNTSYREVAKRMKILQEQQRRVVENMKKIKYKIAILSSKGGVGKSFVTVTLAAALASMGKKVAVFDADVHGPSVHKMLGLPTGLGLPARPDGTIEPIEVPPGLKVVSIGLLLPTDETPVIWRGPLKTSAIRELLAYVDWGELDYLLIDLPPGTGDEQLTIAQLIPQLTGVILVTIPSEVSKTVVMKAAAFARRLGVPIIGVIENMSYFECPDGSKHYIFGKGAAKEIAEQFNIPYLGDIPIDPKVREANDAGKILFLEYPDSKASKAFLSIAEKVVKIVEEGGLRPSTGNVSASST